MTPAENIKRLIIKFCQTKESSARTTAALDKRILDDAIAELQTSADGQINIWRTIMKSRITKLAVAALIIMAIAFSIVVINKTAKPVWAIEQTVEALDNIQTVVVSGVDNYKNESVPFKFWLRFLDNNSASFELRYASDKAIFVVKDTRAWAYWPGDNTVKVYEDVKASDGMIRDLQGVYQLAEMNPWITARVFETLKSFAGDWQETYGKDEKTGRDCVFVTCSYKPLSMSFWLVCDVENKLIIEGKIWKNADRQGPPECHAISFTYNEEIPDNIFDFQIPQGAKVINADDEMKARALLDSGEKLFQQKDYNEAIKIYQQVYENNHKLNVGEEALMMVGICFKHLGQSDKAIETYEKCIREYPNLKGWIDATYFYLGCAYIENGQKDEALEAFKNCLVMGEGIRQPDKFPLKDAREYIKKLKNPESATIINKEEPNKARTLFNSGEKLFQQKDFNKAMKIYQQVYEQYPKWNIGEEALFMVGYCYSNLGQKDKAIETYEKCVREFPNLKGLIETTYFNLGCAYMETGQKDKALDAFKNCLIMGEGVRSPDKYPLKDARECIKKLENQK